MTPERRHPQVSEDAAAVGRLQDGEEPGTVWVAVAWPNGVHAEVHRLPGDPSEVVSGAIALAVRLLRAVLEDPTGPEGADAWGDQPAPLLVEDLRD